MQGPEDEGATGVVEGKSLVLVTVGSTKFEDLLEVVDSAAFVEAVVARGYEALVVQYGPHAAHAPLHLPRLAKEHGLAYQAFAMSSSFASVLAQAALVISHAGAPLVCMSCSSTRNPGFSLVSCRVVSCRVVSCRVVSCRVVSCRVVCYGWRPQVRARYSRDSPSGRRWWWS
jgi:hypothetical protein